MSTKYIIPLKLIITKLKSLNLILKIDVQYHLI